MDIPKIHNAPADLYVTVGELITSVELMNAKITQLSAEISALKTPTKAPVVKGNLTERRRKTIHKILELHREYTNAYADVCSDLYTKYNDRFISKLEKLTILGMSNYPKLTSSLIFDRNGEIDTRYEPLAINEDSFEFSF